MGLKAPEHAGTWLELEHHITSHYLKEHKHQVLIQANKQISHSLLSTYSYMPHSLELYIQSYSTNGLPFVYLRSHVLAGFAFHTATVGF